MTRRPPLENFVLAQRFWRWLTSRRLVDSVQPGGRLNPAGVAAAAGLIGRAAMDCCPGGDSVDKDTRLRPTDDCEDCVNKQCLRNF